MAPSTHGSQVTSPASRLSNENLMTIGYAPVAAESAAVSRRMPSNSRQRGRSQSVTKRERSTRERASKARFACFRRSSGSSGLLGFVLTMRLGGSRSRPRLLRVNLHARAALARAGLRFQKTMHVNDEIAHRGV